MKNKTLWIVISLCLAIALISGIISIGSSKSKNKNNSQNLISPTPINKAENQITITPSPMDSEPEVGVLAFDLKVPWQSTRLPDGRILFTERVGRVRVIEENILDPMPIIDLESIVSKQGEGGLLGIAADPDFSTNGHIYIYYTFTNNKKELKNRLVRYKELDKNSFKEDGVIIDNIPGGVNHNGGILEFGPDGKLYIGVGERFVKDVAQNLNDLGGKILRINKDGSIPADNPFENSYIWSYGHRNPQGFTWGPDGTMYSTEHGPSGEQGCCKDELNIIEKGKNYGWPIISGNQTKEGLISPLLISGDNVTWAPGDIEYIKSGLWKDSLVFTGLRSQALYKVILDKNNSKKIEKVEELYKSNYGRLRLIHQLSNGEILISTSNQDGRGSAREKDDKILILK